MRYSVVQVELGGYPARRENIGLLAEDALGRCREIWINKSSVGGRFALGKSTLLSLEESLKRLYDSGNWKERRTGSFLEYLHEARNFHLHFSFPELAPNVPGGLRILYEGRVQRGLKEVVKGQKNILTTRALNAVLLVYCLSLVGHLDKLSLQKILYLAELSQETRGCSGLKYGFFKYLRGPFSREIYGHVDALEARGVVEKSGYMIRMTKMGEGFLGEFSKLLEEHTIAVEIIRETVSRWRDESKRDLINAAYLTMPMQQAGFSDDLLPFDPRERFSWIATSISEATAEKLEAIVLSGPGGTFVQR